MQLKFGLIMSLYLFTTCPLQAQDYDFSLFHYNIKELDSTKITTDNEQLKYVSAIIKKYNIDILSLNEIQYDYPGIPSAAYTSEGQNIRKLKWLFELDNLKTYSFYPANTGKGARRKTDGTYFVNPNEEGARDYADQINFGTMPGQYSTGSLTKFKKINEKIITNLRWKDFNKNVNISKFRSERGRSLPKTMQLFDKNFSDITLDVNGKELHLITFHTVPAFGFGNDKTPNFERNADQLRFLRWYVTGKSDIGRIKIPINPIVGKNFIIVGDLNTDINDTSKEGSRILLELFKDTNTWIDQSKMTFSNESSHFGENPFRLMLDYIITSKSIDTIEGEIIHPNFERTDLGCEIDPTQVNINSEQKIVKYIGINKKECFAIIDKSYFEMKNASDHYPIYGKFKFNENF